MVEGYWPLLDDALVRLRRAGVPSPEADAWALASHLVGLSRGELQAKLMVGSLELNDATLSEFERLVTRRVEREPLWHITGRAPFLELELDVGAGVFTPRPETELLAHHARAELALMHPSDGSLRVVDLCAGSGALGIAVVAPTPHAELVAVEISAEAAVFLRTNANRLVPGRADIIEGDIGQIDSHPWAGTVDLLVSNPPYLIPGEPLDHETHFYDPELALFGGSDGLDVVRRVVEQSSSLLRPGGVVLIEHGVGHGSEVSSLLEAAGFTAITTERDLVGRDRFSRASRR